MEDRRLHGRRTDTDMRNHRRAILHLLSSILVCALVALGGCTNYPWVVPAREQKPVDRSVVETPAGYALVPFVKGLTAPTAIAIDNEEGPHKGTVLVAESGAGGADPRVIGIRPDGTVFNVYPSGRPIPIPLLRTGFQIYGPIGGMVVTGGKILVTHRDAHGMGTITALGYDGSHETIVADLPAQGDYSVTDIAVSPRDGRIFFGVGAATNSGVVGLDNWAVGWVNDYAQFCDVPYVALKLLGYRFDTTNPKGGGLFGAETAVTAPFQPFNVSNQTRIAAPTNGKPGAALYSAAPTGGDLRVEAHGIRLPRGLAFDIYSNLYFTNNGMELRGTRPVKDDPDVIVKFVGGTWYGWPDYSADLYPIAEERFRELDLLVRHGYPELAFLIDHDSSRLASPVQFREQLLRATFPSQSGAAKLDFVKETGPFAKDFRGEAVVALSGNRAPFATSGRKLEQAPGREVMLVDLDRRTAKSFIRNTADAPGSQTGERDALERPIDVKFSNDGALYVLDYGRMTVVDGHERVKGGTGRILRLVPLDALTTIPSTQPDASGRVKTQRPLTYEPGVRP